MGYIGAPSKGSQNIAVAPRWWAAIKIRNPSCSAIMCGTGSWIFILGSSYHADEC